MINIQEITRLALTKYEKFHRRRLAVIRAAKELEAMENIVEPGEQDVYEAAKIPIAKTYAAIEADIFTMTERQILRQQIKRGGHGWKRKQHGAWLQGAIDNIGAGR